MNNWKAIWNRRARNGERADLDTLIKLDGFDTGAGRIDVNDWRHYTANIAKKLGIVDGVSVYEVGCGAGAFLYALCEQFSIVVGGIDYATGLIAAASHVMPYGHFKEGDANKFDIAPHYDFVIANSVFHYFSREYASEVLARMIKKAKIAVAVMEIPDSATKEESEALRRDITTPEEYERKYKGLEHTYYVRGWFEEEAKARGLTFEMFDGCIPNYAQNRFRFGCIIRK
jgi:SAM-dependent methyltransferase